MKENDKLDLFKCSNDHVMCNNVSSLRKIESKVNEHGLISLFLLILYIPIRIKSNFSTSISDAIGLILLILYFIIIVNKKSKINSRLPLYIKSVIGLIVESACWLMFVNIMLKIIRVIELKQIIVLYLALAFFILVFFKLFDFLVIKKGAIKFDIRSKVNRTEKTKRYIALPGVVFAVFSSFTPLENVRVIILIICVFLSLYRLFNSFRYMSELMKFNI